uniref:Nonstructural protein n=1 Tax=Soybean vein necrosis virus TaxID=980895 RepID=A0A7H1KW15_9VIRU|nr:nonstructural protein [Soybean vein necrosis virus]
MQNLITLGRELGSQKNQKCVIDTYWLKTKFIDSSRFGSNYIQMFSDEHVQSGFRFNEPVEESYIEDPDTIVDMSSDEVFPGIGIRIIFDKEKVVFKIDHKSVNRLGVKHKGHLKLLEFENPNIIEGTVDKTLVSSIPGICAEDITVDDELTGLLPSMNITHMKEDSYKITKSNNCFFGKRNMMRRGWIGTGNVTSIHPVGYSMPASTNRCIGTLALKSLESTAKKGIRSTDISHAEIDINGLCNFHLFTSCKGDLGDKAWVKTLKFFHDDHERVFSIYIRTTSDIDNNISNILLIFKVLRFKKFATPKVIVSQDDDSAAEINLSEGSASGCFDLRTKSVVIVQSLMRIHNEFALSLSKFLKKKVIVYTLRDSLSFTKKVAEIDSRFLNYLEDSDGNIYLLSRTFQESLPLNRDSLSYFFDLQTFGWAANHAAGDLATYFE